MKKLFIAFLLFCQISPAFAYDENNFIEKMNSLSTTFTLQSTNFFGESNKMKELTDNPNFNQQHFQMLYITSAQSLCISVITLEKIQSLIRENPQAIGSVLTKEHISKANDKTDLFNDYMKAFQLDNQGCRELMPYTYESMMND